MPLELNVASLQGDKSDDENSNNTCSVEKKNIIVKTNIIQAVLSLWFRVIVQVYL